MKKFLVGLITFLISILITLLGVSFSLKAFIVDNTNNIIEKELVSATEEVLKEIDEIPEEAKVEVKKILEENKEIKKIMGNYFDIALDVLSGKTNIDDINITKDVEKILDESEGILKDYGITLSDDDKKQILDAVSDEEVTKVINDSIKDLQKEMPKNLQTGVQVYSFINSLTCKLVIIGIIILGTILIALLKKSYYKWLGNLGVAAIVSGLFLGFIVPFVIGFIVESIEDINITLSTSSFVTFGAITLIVGVVLSLAGIVLNKVIKPKGDVV